MTKVFLILLFVTVIGGCVYPNQQVQTADDRPGLMVTGAPEDAVLYVDGLDMGLAQKYSGNPNMLLLSPGTHSVEIRHGDKVLRSINVFLGEGTHKEIKLSDINKPE